MIGSRAPDTFSTFGECQFKVAVIHNRCRVARLGIVSVPIRLPGVVKNNLTAVALAT
jgi:hypothetical protein